MQYSRWLFVPAVLAACMLLVAPLKADAASSGDASVKKVSASSKAASKKSASKDVRNAKRNVKKTSAQKQKTQRKNGKKQSRVTRESVDSRDVWLRRAQESEIMTGKASWYGRDFHGGPTASGLNYDMYTFTAAHRTLPMGTVVRVTDQENGKSVMVCVTDRGPFVRGRIIDLSYAAAQQIDIGNKGVGRVALEVVSDESGTPLSPDEAYYVRYKAAMGDETLGPYRAFADAAAMHEAVRQVHPEAVVVLGNAAQR
ncbi:septal ring lytic transglycosylase RlpA family protein [Desulfovibrio legallii]|uniref:Probable endolytic peptidoglycan transglycosylase RlpA n=2 Tax=Bacteria TaxID=2 RepID=A0A6H3FET2_9BACT|nr:septal ring lytic transglycosylase RlpA family protein [Desulfovibrio legallii]RHH22139.1 septal ring lytic transglycosylase RlpA family protein [Desulfovibrio sp. AM18-2]TBH80555.1 septal ring lytic transglycosylase RlpA family protein [Desulfovibrio legallii]CAI3241855.1 rare lipoprotein A family protein [Desulfovibrio diazotrophicus]